LLCIDRIKRVLASSELRVVLGCAVVVREEGLERAAAWVEGSLRVLTRRGLARRWDHVSSGLTRLPSQQNSLPFILKLTIVAVTT
jgi:hypothetical protein